MSRTPEKGRTDRPSQAQTPVNWAEARRWFLEQNLFGSGATLSDVAEHFGCSLDQVKKRSAAQGWAEERKARQEDEARRQHREVCRSKEIDVVEERLAMLADRDLGRAVLRHKLQDYARDPDQLSAAEVIKLAQWVGHTTQVAAGLSSKIEVTQRSDAVSRKIEAQQEAAGNVVAIEQWRKRNRVGDSDAD